MVVGFDAVRSSTCLPAARCLSTAAVKRLGVSGQFVRRENTSLFVICDLEFVIGKVRNMSACVRRCRTTVFGAYNSSFHRQRLNTFGTRRQNLATAPR